MYFPSPVSPQRPGSLLLEAIVSIAIFAIFLGGIGLAMLVGEHNTIAGGDRARGVFLAEQSLEGVRQMRTTSFASLTVGSHGVTVGSSGRFSFSGSSLKTTDGYKSQVDITSLASDWLAVSARSSWNFGKARSGSVLLTTYITDWRKILTIGNWAAMSLVSSTTMSGTPEFQHVAVSGNYAFVTSLRSGGGKGLYIYDISNMASPVRVATGFDLGASAYGLLIDGTTLYLATDAPSAEVQVYDISSPSTLSLSKLLGSFNLAGTGRARSLAAFGQVLFVGATDDATGNELFSLSVEDPAAITQEGSIDIQGGVTAISLHDGYAYLSTTANSGEMQVVDIFDPYNMAFAPGTGIDLTDVYDGGAIATFGTSALLGRANGTTISELILYSTKDAPVPTPPPGPWTQEIGGSVADLANVYGGKYAFVASDASSAGLRVIDVPILSVGGSSIVKTYDAGAPVRGVYYYWQTDRLVSVTNNKLFILKPG